MTKVRISRKIAKNWEGEAWNKDLLKEDGSVSFEASAGSRQRLINRNGEKRGRCASSRED